MKIKNIGLPLDKKSINKLKVADKVAISGIIYTARDQAHKRLIDLLKSKKSLPIGLKGQVIYYCGPTPGSYGKNKQKSIGSCGPTTSSRMDKYTPMLLQKGVSGMMGKGRRGLSVISAIKKYRCVYFVTYAGCGALLNQFVKKAQKVAFLDLGPEAIHKLEVENFPAIVAIDPYGRSIY